MDENRSTSCPHFQLHSEPLDLDGPTAYLALRHCLLTERMIRLLQQSNDGTALVEKLVVHAAHGKTFAFVGPDLEAVTQHSCSFQRCEERCTPAYEHNLKIYQIVDPRQNEVSCNDTENTDSDEEQPATKEPCPSIWSPGKS